MISNNTDKVKNEKMVAVVMTHERIMRKYPLLKYPCVAGGKGVRGSEPFVM